MPSAHLFNVLKVAGNTTTASARGKTSGSSGCLYSLRKLEIPLPPMERQQQLREVKAKVDALKRLQAELDALLPAVLDKAFKGELV